MTTEIDGLDAFDDQVAALEASLGGATAMAASFDAELIAMRDAMTWTGREVSSLSRSIGTGLRNAFDGLVFDGMRASDAMRQLALSIADTVYSAAMKPVQNALGGLIAGGINAISSAILPFENGASFSQGRVVPFASGGIVSSPTYFAMRGATGLMGEAGPEAIMPLSRGADGRLGVRSEGGGRAVNVVMNITTPDIEGFRKSRSQVAAEVSRALSRGQRNR